MLKHELMLSEKMRWMTLDNAKSGRKHIQMESDTFSKNLKRHEEVSWRQEARSHCWQPLLTGFRDS